VWRTSGKTVSGGNVNLSHNSYSCTPTGKQRSSHRLCLPSNNQKSKFPVYKEEKKNDSNILYFPFIFCPKLSRSLFAFTRLDIPFWKTIQYRRIFPQKRRRSFCGGLNCSCAGFVGIFFFTRNSSRLERSGENVPQQTFYPPLHTLRTMSAWVSSWTSYRGEILWIRWALKTTQSLKKKERKVYWSRKRIGYLL